jgi:hypothetical protein
MRSRALGIVLGAGALSLGLLSPTASVAQPATAPPLAGADLLAALRAGGHILYFRHADTDHSQVDQRGMRLEDCTAQRNLTDRGREHSLKRSGRWASPSGPSSRAPSAGRWRPPRSPSAPH